MSNADDEVIVESGSVTIPSGGSSDGSMMADMRLDLTKESITPLLKLSIAAGWNTSLSGSVHDMDLAAIGLRGGIAVSFDDICYFKMPSAHNGAIKTVKGDDRTGASSVGDDEQIDIILTGLAAEVDSIVFILNIHDAAAKGQSFKDIESAYIRAFNTESNQELARVEVSASTDNSDHIVFASVNRVGDSWVFVNISEYGTGDLNVVLDKLEGK